MPEKKSIERAQKDKREGKSASTQAGEFVKEQIDHIRKGKHGARSTKQAIAIGLSEARRAGVDLPPPKKGTVTEKTRKSAERAYAKGHGSGNGRIAKHKVSIKRSRATEQALQRESTRAASHDELSKHAKTAARARTAAERSASAKKAARTKGHAARVRAARKAARTRAAHKA